MSTTTTTDTTTTDTTTTETTTTTTETTTESTSSTTTTTSSTTTTTTTSSTTTTSTTTTTTTTTTTIAPVDYEIVDGFDHLSEAQVTRKWDSDSGVPTSMVTGRIDGKAARFLNAPAPLKYTSPTPRASWTACFAVRPSSFPATVIIAQFMDDASNQVELRVNTLGQIQFTRNGTTLFTSSMRLYANLWQYIEWAVTIDSVAGAVKVRISEQTAIDQTGINSQNTGNATANVFKLAPASSAAAWLFDDFTLIQGFDTPGEMRVQTKMPSAPGTFTQWTPTGAASGWQATSENPADDDTSYVKTVTVGNQEVYVHAAFDVQGQIMAIQSNLMIRKDDVASRAVGHRVHVGGTTFDGDVSDCLTDYRVSRSVWKNNPNTTNPWSLSEANSAQFGQKLIA